MLKSITPRPNYCDTPGANRAAYLETQRELFGACRENGLPVEGDAREKMILAVARYLGDKSITSRKQLTPEENTLITEAINRRFFDAQWLLHSQAYAATTLRAIIDGNARRTREAAARITAGTGCDLDDIID